MRETPALKRKKKETHMRETPSLDSGSLAGMDDTFRHSTFPSGSARRSRDSMSVHPEGIIAVYQMNATKGITLSIRWIRSARYLRKTEHLFKPKLEIFLAELESLISHSFGKLR
jgi:hypothetical protein